MRFDLLISRGINIIVVRPLRHNGLQMIQSDNSIFLSVPIKGCSITTSPAPTRLLKRDHGGNVGDGLLILHSVSLRPVGMPQQRGRVRSKACVSAFSSRPRQTSLTFHKPPGPYALAANDRLSAETGRPRRPRPQINNADQGGKLHS